MQTTSDTEALYRRLFWRFVPVLFVAYIVSYLDRVNVGFAKLQMLDDLKFSNDVYALGASIFFIGYACCEAPSNLLMHRFGARIWLMRIMVTWGIVSGAMAFIGDIAHALGVESRWVFYATRLLLGICEAGFFPGVVLFFNYWFPVERQGLVLSKFMLALPISLVIGGPASGAIMGSMNGLRGWDGWQWLFLLEAVPAIALGVLLFTTLDNRIQDARWLSDDEKRVLSAAVDTPVAHARMNRIADALKDRNYWMLGLVLLCTNAGFYGLSFWLPSIIKNAGVHSTFDIGLITAIPFGAGAIGMYWNGEHSRRTGELQLHLALPLLVSGSGLMLSTWFGQNFWLSIAFVSVASAGVMAMMPLIWAVPGRMLASACLAAGIGLLNTLGQLSGVIGSNVSNLAERFTGRLENGNYVLGGMLLLGGVLILCIARRCFVQPRSREPGSPATRLPAAESAASQHA